MSISRAGSVNRGVLIALVWVLSIPVAEVVFRLLGDRPSDDLAGLVYGIWSGTLLPWLLIDTEAKWAAGKFTVHTDRLGLRCDGERRLALDRGSKVDVLFLGDSQGFGNGVSFEESICGAVAELGLHDGMRIANASVGAIPGANPA